MNIRLYLEKRQMTSRFWTPSRALAPPLPQLRFQTSQPGCLPNLKSQSQSLKTAASCLVLKAAATELNLRSLCRCTKITFRDYKWHQSKGNTWCIFFFIMHYAVIKKKKSCLIEFLYLSRFLRIILISTFSGNSIALSAQFFFRMK